MKVGDYVRYKYENCVYIGKIKFVSEVMGFEETLQLDIDTCMEEILKEDIIKSSPNIIDLIEVGDYVNGVRVEKNKYGELYTSYVYYGGDIGKQCEVYTTWLKEYTEDMIENILIKEQFEEMEYKIND